MNSKPNKLMSNSTRVILQCLLDSPRGYTVQEIAKKVNMKATLVHTTLSLMSCAYPVAEDDEGRKPIYFIPDEDKRKVRRCLVTL